MIYIVSHKNLILKDNYINDDSFQKNYQILNLLDIQNKYTDDLILQLHPYLNEWVGQYYVHEYLKNNDDIFGFCHYRRIIDNEYVNIDRIKNTNGVQFFCIYNESIDFYVIDVSNKKEFCYVDIHAQYWRNYTLYNDFIEFNHSIGKNIIDINKLNNVMNVENYWQYLWHPSRELFISTKENFNLIFDYIYAFVKFILNKYDIKTVDDFKTHIVKDTHNNMQYDNYEEGQHKTYYWRGYAVFIEYIIGILIKYYCNGFGEYLYDKKWKNEYKYFKK